MADRGDTGDTGETGKQGEPGETGIQGVQGVQGIRGAQGVPGNITGLEGKRGEPGRAGVQGEPGKSAQVVLNKRIEVSFWAMLLVFVGVVSFMGYEFKEVRDLAQSHEAVLKENARIRADLVRGFEAANQRLCEGQELLKQQNREQAIKDFNRLEETLDLLGLELTPAILERATRDRDHTLSINAPRPDGCQQ